MDKAIIVLCLLFAIKHFIGDYLLQLDGSSGEKRLSGVDGIIALANHAMYHGLFTYGVVVIYLLFMWLSPSRYISLNEVYAGVINIWYFGTALGFLDAFSHFWIDWAKIWAEKKFTRYPYWKLTLDFIMPKKTGTYFPPDTKFNKRLNRSLTVLDQFLHGVVTLGLIAILLKYS